MASGFFCADLTIRYPYHECTISVPMLAVSTLMLPMLFIAVVEIIRACNEFRWREYLRQLSHSLVPFSGGYIATYLTVEFAKNVIGRLRPHFYTACQPRLANGQSCEDLGPADHIYIDEYVCSNAQLSAAQLRELYVSFPSAHSALSFYAMLYLCFYLHKVWHRRQRRDAMCRFLRHLVQFAMLMVAWFIALSRVVDHWHHWTDVLAGLVMGIAYAVVTACYCSDLLGPSQRQQQQQQHIMPNEKPLMTASCHGCHCGGSRDGGCGGGGGIAAKSPPVRGDGCLGDLQQHQQQHFQHQFPHHQHLQQQQQQHLLQQQQQHLQQHLQHHDELPNSQLLEPSVPAECCCGLCKLAPALQTTMVVPI